MPITQNQFDPLEMAREMSLPLMEILRTLGLPTSSSEAKRISESLTDAAEIREICEIWDDLTADEAGRANNGEAAEAAFHSSREGSSARDKALRRWIEVGTQDEVRKAITFAEPGSDEREIGIRKLAKFFGYQDEEE
ncbi:MAG: hypothetical protein HGA31_03320 [Candidatus Moranbacteria bacterium]|nr:hypothetical protein [Candidatus Moranbacteria bacterium]